MRSIRSQVSLAALCALTALTGGCATRGALDIACVDKSDVPRNFAHDLEPGRLERQIRALAPQTTANKTTPQPDGDDSGGSAPPPPSPDDALLDQLIAEALIGDDPESGGQVVSTSSKDPRAKLLLSGGGQWGAYGAGLLTTLSKSGKMPEVVAVTGVSTGALQALFVGAGLTNHADAMIAAYSPRREDEVVNRGAKEMAIIRGSIAGLKPLRKRIEDALCQTDGNGKLNCPVITALARPGAPVVQLGFVEARSGKFQYVTVGEIARDANLTDHQKRSCIAGAALASVAMPLFFQQVQVNGITYFDGGVRQSVFTEFLSERVERVRARSAAQSRREAPAPLPVYVIRNGPTYVKIDENADKVRDGITTAERAQSIIVNEVEVGSIAELRLENPSGPIFFSTADGYHDFGWAKPGFPTCGAIKDAKANQGAMFIPDFMQCLMAYGTDKALKEQAWTALDTITPATRRQ